MSFFSKLFHRKHKNTGPMPATTVSNPFTMDVNPVEAPVTSISTPVETPVTETHDSTVDVPAAEETAA